MSSLADPITDAGKVVGFALWLIGPVRDAGDAGPGRRQGAARRAGVDLRAARRSIGAEAMSEWTVYRLGGQALADLAGK